jgi:hypothetical protein
MAELLHVNNLSHAELGQVLAEVVHLLLEPLVPGLARLIIDEVEKLIQLFRGQSDMKEIAFHLGHADRSHQTWRSNNFLEQEFSLPLVNQYSQRSVRI